MKKVSKIVVVLLAIVIAVLSMASARRPATSSPCSSSSHTPCVIEKTVTPKSVCKDVLIKGVWFTVCKIG